MGEQNAAPTLVFVGTYTGTAPHDWGRGEGISVFEMDPSSGALKLLGTERRSDNPNFLAIHPNRRFLYSVAEGIGKEGWVVGGVNAFSLDPTTGALQHLNWEPVQGDSPCHLSVDATGRCVVTGNYTSGSASVLPIGEEPAVNSELTDITRPR